MPEWRDGAVYVTVTELCGFCWRSGDIDLRIARTKPAKRGAYDTLPLDGAGIHRLLEAQAHYSTATVDDLERERSAAAAVGGAVRRGGAAKPSGGASAGGMTGDATGADPSAGASGDETGKPADGASSGGADIASYDDALFDEVLASLFGVPGGLFPGIPDEGGAPRMSYASEVPLGVTLTYNGIGVRVVGRADGVWFDGRYYTIEEIKSGPRSASYAARNPAPAELAQALLYAHMLVNGVGASHVGGNAPITEGVNVRMTFADSRTGEAESATRAYTCGELRDFFDETIRRYAPVIEALARFETGGRAALAKAPFPYGEPRAGQRDFMVTEMRAIREGRRLVAQAPTGTGKTMAAVFPALKSYAAGRVGKIFYLTAKNLTGSAALDSAKRIDGALKSAGAPKFLLCSVIVSRTKCCALSEAGFRQGSSGDAQNDNGDRLDAQDAGQNGVVAKDAAAGAPAATGGSDAAAWYASLRDASLRDASLRDAQADSDGCFDCEDIYDEDEPLYGGDRSGGDRSDGEYPDDEGEFGRSLSPEEEREILRDFSPGGLISREMWLAAFGSGAYKQMKAQKPAAPSPAERAARFRANQKAKQSRSRMEINVGGGAAVYKTDKEYGGETGADSIASVGAGTDGAQSAAARARARGLVRSDYARFYSSERCSPADCPRARGHYSRVSAAVADILEHETVVERDALAAYAAKHCVCPYELALDVSEYAAMVVCDLNYLFDPRVRLRRYFAEPSPERKFVFLIDEAHNLPDRARDIYSATLDSAVYDALASFCRRAGRPMTAEAATAMADTVRGWAPLCGDNIAADSEGVLRGQGVYKQPPPGAEDALRLFASRCEAAFAAGEEPAGVADIYYDARSALDILSFFDDRYVTIVTVEGAEVSARLYCLDPSRLLDAAMSRGRSSVLFSATMSPLPYFADILGCSRSDERIELPYPFDPENLAVIAYTGADVRYNSRENTAGDVVSVIHATAAAKPGNYIVFLQSYDYMRAVAGLYAQRYPNERLVIQSRGMGERRKEEFLSSFREDTAQIGFCVLGGAFAEGVDLRGNRLVGVVIVGVGLPVATIDRAVVADYYERTREDGYAYAYVYPGMIKVQQAAGRVIRSRDDRGVVVLVDDRYAGRDYMKLFPDSWRGARLARSPAAVASALRRFWSK